MNFLSLLIISVTFNVTANILLKKGIESVGGVSGKLSTLILEITKALGNPYIVIGIILYGTSFMIWLRVLSFNDLSRSYPIFASLVFLFTTIASFFILKESIGMLRIVGIIITLFGIFIVSRS